MTDPAFDFATYIGDNIPGLTLGDNLRYGHPRALPKTPDVVFVRATAGPAPTRVHSGRYEIREPIIHVRARARTNAVASGWATQIQDLMQTAQIPGYMDVEPLQSSPTSVGEGETQLVYYLMSFKLMYERDAQDP